MTKKENYLNFLFLNVKLWLIYFCILQSFRLLLIFSFSNNLKTDSLFIDLLKTSFKGAAFDSSVASYFILPMFLTLFVSLFFKVISTLKYQCFYQRTHLIKLPYLLLKCYSINVISKTNII